MKSLKISRFLWMLAGICFFISFIFNLNDGKAYSLLVLNIVTSILCFINAAISHIRIHKKE